MKFDRKYIMTAIAYVNAKPHLGHALEFILGDAFLRYWRENNLDVLGQTGTDEYGQKLERKAKEEGIEPIKYCDMNSQHFRDLMNIFNLTYDQFIRTTDQNHHKTVQELWRRSNANGDIYKRKYTGLYCTGCESFLQERDLVDGKCIHHKKPPEEVEEENYFFRLSKYQDDILKWLKDNPEIVFPKSRYNEIINVIESGLEDISISRPKSSLTWGVPVPDDYEHVMYVWFDALTNYITGAGCFSNSDKFEKWWGKESQSIHLIGKDIIRHHIAIWPAMLMSAGIPLPKQYIVHGFVLVDGQKMSKSLGNVVDPVECAGEYGSDALRWYLLKEIPNGQDGSMQQDRFIEIYNADLANNIGNLFNRVTTLIRKYDIDIPKDISDNEKILDIVSKYHTDFDNFRVDSAATRIIELSNIANALIEDSKPWVLAKADQDKLNKVMIDLYYYLEAIYRLSIPFIPNAAEKMKISLGLDNQRKVEKVDVLFPRVETN